VVARIASEHGIDPASVPGTGTGGRGTKKDILAFIELGAPSAPSLEAAPAPEPGPTAAEPAAVEPQPPPPQAAPAAPPAADPPPPPAPPRPPPPAAGPAGSASSPRACPDRSHRRRGA